VERFRAAPPPPVPFPSAVLRNRVAAIRSEPSLRSPAPRQRHVGGGSTRRSQRKSLRPGASVESPPAHVSSRQAAGAAAMIRRDASCARDAGLACWLPSAIVVCPPRNRFGGFGRAPMGRSSLPREAPRSLKTQQHAHLSTDKRSRSVSRFDAVARRFTYERRCQD
jgi:hypothetical protein